MPFEKEPQDHRGWWLIGTILSAFTAISLIALVLGSIRRPRRGSGDTLSLGREVTAEGIRPGEPRERRENPEEEPARGWSVKARRREPSSPPARRPDRWAGAIISGFIATMAMLFTLLVAYYVAGATSQSLPQDNPLMVWLWSLTHNSLVDVASRSFVAALGLHLTFGLIWAVVYAYFFEPVLPGNDWQKGLLFALLPWILSLVVFLPIAGAGILGLALGAGPLPIIGNLILHLVYGAALGLLYGLGAESWALGLPQAPAAPEEYQRLVARRSEVGTAVGLLAGTVVGGAVGWLTCGLAIAAFGAQLAVVDIGVLVLVSVIIGGSGGALVGSLAGIGGRALS